MYEYINNEEGLPEYRRVYIVYCDGDELGALFSEEAAQTLVGALIDNGVEPALVWINHHIQPIEHADWLTESLHLEHE